MNNTCIEYVRLLQHCAPCVHVVETSSSLFAQCIYEFDKEKLIQLELAQVRKEQDEKIKTNSVACQKDDPRMERTKGTSQPTQTEEKVMKTARVQTRVQLG